MPAVPSPRAFAARARIAVRAASGGAISGPNRAMLRTSFGAATARCWQTMVPSEWPSQCARVTLSRVQTESSVSTKRSIVSGPSTAVRAGAARHVDADHAVARQRRHQRREGVAAAAEAVHADDGVALAFVLDDDPIEDVQRHGGASHSNRFSIAPMPSISIRTTSPAPQPLRRLEAHADARRRAGGDDVAGIERDAARAGLDQRRDVEDHVAGAAVLAQLAVDPAAHARVAAVELVGGR